MNIGIATLADFPHATVFKSNVGFDDAEFRIHDERIGDDGVGHFIGGQLRLTHPVANDFSATELDLFAVGGEVRFDFDEQLRICQTHTITRGGAKHFCIRATIYRSHFFVAFLVRDFVAFAFTATLFVVGLFATAFASSAPITLP